MARGKSRPRLRAVLRRHGLWRRPSRLRRFLRTHELRFTEGNRVEVFEHGKSGLSAMLEAIREARLRVHFETYILRRAAHALLPRLLDSGMEFRRLSCE
jgi:phosphatidylserine/phosphatidylglycerophosphate/cardiolipin synthase-like enzyme